MSAVLPSPSLAILPGRRRLVARLAFAVGVLVLLAVALAALPGLDEVRRRFGDAVPGWLALSVALEAGSCLAFVVAYRGVLSGRLAWGVSYEVGMAVQGANVLLPAGGTTGLAVGAWALGRAGVPSERLVRRSVAFFVVTSAVNFATAILSGTALALGLLKGDAALALTVGPAALAAASIVAVLVLPRLLTRPHSPAGRLGRAAGALGEGIREAGALVRSGDPLILAGAIGYMAFDVAALAAAFGAVGALPPIGVLLLAYVVGQLGGLIPLPGGVGGADGGLIAALVLYGTPLADAAAAVLAYRVFQLGLPALLGTLALVRLPRVVSRIGQPPAGLGAPRPVV